MTKIPNWRVDMSPKDFHTGTWTIRYFNSVTAKQLQISRYRDADEFDKHMGYDYKWHGKWYVNIWSPERVFLFDTKSNAVAFANKYMRSHTNK